MSRRPSSSSPSFSSPARGGLRAGALALVVVPAALLALLWLAPGPLAHWRHWQPPPPREPGLDGIRAAVLQPAEPAIDLQPVLDRPLFSPTRRPGPVAAGGEGQLAQPEPNPLEGAALRGIIDGPTLSGIMLDAGGSTRFVRVGEALGSWTLERIEGGEAVFEREGKRQRLRVAPSGGDAADGDAAAPATGAAEYHARPAASAAASPKRAAR